MFRKLKLKFIGISTLSMMIVLFLVLGLVNIISYRNALINIFSTLEFVSKHSEENLDEADIKKIKNDRITLETMYEARYITVMIDSNNTMININNEHIAAINNDEIDSFVNNVTGIEKERGIFTYDGLQYAYLKTKEPDGNVKLTILDCTRTLSSARFFVKFSFYIGTLSILLLILLLSVFARKVVEPYVKNAEAQKQFITNVSKLKMSVSHVKGSIAANMARPLGLAVLWGCG